MAQKINILKGIRKYTFLLSPHAGILKEIVENELVKIDHGEDGVEYRLTPASECSNLGIGEAVPGVIVEKTDPPYIKGEGFLFIVKSLFIPIVFSFVGFFIAVVSNMSFSNPIEFTYSLGIFLFFVGYVYMFIKKDFTEPLPMSILLGIIIGIFIVSISLVMLDYFGQGLMTNIVVNLYWFIVFVELVLKPTKIILSDNNRYWKYIVSNEENKKSATFYMITPRGMKK